MPGQKGDRGYTGLVGAKGGFNFNIKISKNLF